MRRYIHHGTVESEGAWSHTPLGAAMGASAEEEGIEVLKDIGVGTYFDWGGTLDTHVLYVSDWLPKNVGGCNFLGGHVPPLPPRFLRL